MFFMSAVLRVSTLAVIYISISQTVVQIVPQGVLLQLEELVV